MAKEELKKEIKNLSQPKEESQSKEKVGQAEEQAEKNRIALTQQINALQNDGAFRYELLITLGDIGQTLAKIESSLSAIAKIDIEALIKASKNHKDNDDEEEDEEDDDDEGDEDDEDTD